MRIPMTVELATGVSYWVATGKLLESYWLATGATQELVVICGSAFSRRRKVGGLCAGSWVERNRVDIRHTLAVRYLRRVALKKGCVQEGGWSGTGWIPAIALCPNPNLWCTVFASRV